MLGRLLLLARPLALPPLGLPLGATSINRSEGVEAHGGR